MSSAMRLGATASLCCASGIAASGATSGSARCRIFSRRLTVSRRFAHYPFHLDGAFVLHRLCEVVIHLKTQPDTGAATERLFKPDRHLRRNSALAVNEIVERLSRHAQNFRPCRHAQSQGIKTIMTDDLSGMWRVFHRHDAAPSGTAINPVTIVTCQSKPSPPGAWRLWHRRRAGALIPQSQILSYWRAITPQICQ